MKKIRILTSAIILVIYMFLAFWPQNTILGGKDLMLDMLLKMLIAIALIFIYCIVRFYKKGFTKILIDALVIPVVFEVIIIIASLFTGKMIYGTPLTLVLFILSYIVYYTIYINELNKA